MSDGWLRELAAAPVTTPPAPRGLVVLVARPRSAVAEALVARHGGELRDGSDGELRAFFAGDGPIEAHAAHCAAELAAVELRAGVASERSRRPVALTEAMLLARASRLVDTAAERTVLLDEATARRLDAGFDLRSEGDHWRLLTPAVAAATIDEPDILRATRTGLRFADPAAEAAYLRRHARVALPFIRVGMAVTIAAWLLVLIWAGLSARSYFARVAGGILAGVLPAAACLAATLVQRWRLAIVPLAAVANTVGAALILVVGFALLPPPGPATHGVIWFAYFGMIVLRLDFRVALWSCLPFMAAYVALLLRRFGGRDLDWIVLGLVPPLTAFVTATVVGALLARRSRRLYREERRSALAERRLAAARAKAAELERRARAAELEALGAELRRQALERARDLAGEVKTGRASLSPGDIVDERYRVCRLIGEGGMGSVFEVERFADGQRMALKVLKRGTDGAALARFAREAQIAAELDHPGVVAAFDLGTTANGALFVVMELVAGPALAAQRARFGDPAFALPVLAQLAEALVAIHARGVVHRDLKPENIFVDGQRALIGDFGIARLCDGGDAQPGVTGAGAMLGTPLYMAPELADDPRSARPSSDVFSFGVLAYELIAGGVPYATPPVLLRGERRPLPVVTLRDRHPGLPVAVVELIDDCLAESEARRPTAARIVEVLGSALGREQPAAESLPVSPESQRPSLTLGSTSDASLAGAAPDPAAEADYRRQRRAAAGAQLPLAMLITALIWVSMLAWSAAQRPATLGVTALWALAGCAPMAICFALSRSERFRSSMMLALAVANLVGGCAGVAACWAMQAPLASTHMTVWFIYFGLVILRLEPFFALVATGPAALLHVTFLVLARRLGAVEGHLLISETMVPGSTFVAASLAATVMARLAHDAFVQERAGAAQRARAAVEGERVARLEREAVASERRQLGVELRRHVAERSRSLIERLLRQRSPSLLAPGEIVASRYRVGRVLGEGGMGRVHEVERLADGRRLALKVLTRIGDAAAMARFAREAQIAAALDHRNLVAVRDFGASDEGLLFLVMELVDGPSLASQSARFGDAAWALPRLTQIADALAALHGRGIVHRDLKPSNVLLDGETVKVADFGLARLVGDVRVTQTGAIVGTAPYAAPELAAGAPVAPSADVFSFGVIAAETIAGADVPADLTDLVRACVQPSPAARPTATALAASLGHGLAGRLPLVEMSLPK